MVEAIGLVKSMYSKETLLNLGYIIGDTTDDYTEFLDSETNEMVTAWKVDSWTQFRCEDIILDKSLEGNLNDIFHKINAVHTRIIGARIVFYRSEMIINIMYECPTIDLNTEFVARICNQLLFAYQYLYKITDRQPGSNLFLSDNEFVDYFFNDI